MSQEPFFGFSPAEGQQYYNSPIESLSQRTPNLQIRSGSPYGQISNQQPRSTVYHQQQLQQVQPQIRTQSQKHQSKEFQQSLADEQMIMNETQQRTTPFVSNQFVPGSSSSINSINSYSSERKQSVTTVANSTTENTNGYRNNTDQNTEKNMVDAEAQPAESNSDDDESSSGKAKDDGSSGKKHNRKKLSNAELYQRRKAQNRAAQRAFRERKEGRLRDLSEQLSAVQAEKEKLQRQLEEMKQRNMFLDMENKFLQERGYFAGKDGTVQSAISPITATDTSGSNSSTSPPSANGSFVFPEFTKEKFINGSINMDKHTWVKDQLRSKTYEVDNAAVLTVGAVWDYLVEFAKMNDDINIDIPGVMKDLRGKEVCHGFGPAYKLRLVNETLRHHICKK